MAIQTRYRLSARRVVLKRWGNHLAGISVKHPHHVSLTRGNDPPAIRTELSIEHRQFVQERMREQWRTRGDVPDLDCLIRAGGNKAISVAAEMDRGYPLAMNKRRGEWFPR